MRAFDLMSKILIRMSVLLLIPCLLLKPSLVLGFATSHAFTTSSPPIASNPFTQQALIGRIVTAIFPGKNSRTAHGNVHRLFKSFWYEALAIGDVPDHPYQFDVIQPDRTMRMDDSEPSRGGRQEELKLENLPYRPEWLSSQVETEIAGEIKLLVQSVFPLFEPAQAFSGEVTTVVQNGERDYANAIEIVSHGPDFNRLNDYPHTGRAFWTNVGAWNGSLTHSPILQLSFAGRIINRDIEDRLKDQIENFLRNHMTSTQKALPRKRYSMAKNDYALTNYLSDLLLAMYQIDGVRAVKNDPLPTDWLLIKNPAAIKDIAMVAGGVDAPANWRDEAEAAHKKRAIQGGTGWIASWLPLSRHAANFGLQVLPMKLVSFLASLIDPALPEPLALKVSALSKIDRNAFDLTHTSGQFIQYMPSYYTFVEGVLNDFIHSRSYWIFIGRGSDILFEIAQALVAFDPRFDELRGRIALIDYSRARVRQWDLNVALPFLKARIGKLPPHTNQIVLVDEITVEGHAQQVIKDFAEALDSSVSVIARFMPQDESIKEAAHWLAAFYNSGRAYSLSDKEGTLTQTYDPLEHFRFHIQQHDHLGEKCATVEGAAYYAARRLLQKGIVASWVWSRLNPHVVPRVYFPIPHNNPQQRLIKTSA
jgi:hypothetical protein